MRVLTADLEGNDPGLPRLVTKYFGTTLNHDLDALAIDVMGELGVLYEEGECLREEGHVAGLVHARPGPASGAESRDPGGWCGRARLMRFGLSEEQEAFRDQLQRLLADCAPLARVREVAADGTGFDERLWTGLAEIGAMGVVVPEEFGGLGLGGFEAGLVIEELGRVVAPAPYMSAAFVAPIVLAESPPTALKVSGCPASRWARLALAWRLRKVSARGQGLVLRRRTADCPARRWRCRTRAWRMPLSWRRGETRCGWWTAALLASAVRR
jgi:hypothetical protein